VLSPNRTASKFYTQAKDSKRKNIKIQINDMCEDNSDSSEPEETYVKFKSRKRGNDFPNVLDSWMQKGFDTTYKSTETP